MQKFKPRYVYKNELFLLKNRKNCQGTPPNLGSRTLHHVNPALAPRLVNPTMIVKIKQSKQTVNLGE